MDTRGMKIDGRKIAQDIQKNLAEKIRKEDANILFSLIVVGNNPVTENFIRYKVRFGKQIGITPLIVRFPSSVSQEEFEQKLEFITRESDAVIVQLPLPSSLNEERILSLIPPEKDVDVLSEVAMNAFVSGSQILPPVTGAILHSLESIPTSLHRKNIVLYGYGKLVGRPFAHYLQREHIPFSLIRSTTKDEEKRSLLKNADIIVSGVGVAGLIQKEDIREGIIVIDAGTSESSGSVVGDLHPDAYEKVSFYTPVPGGIGPLTIAVLYENVWKLWKNRH